MSQPIYEVVVYSSSDAGRADAARGAIQSRIRKLPGFLSFRPLVGAENASERADVVTWASLAEAKAAAEIVGSHPDFKAFLSTVTSLKTMGHYRQQTPALGIAGAGLGIEVAFFRLKPSVSEAQARAAHAKAVNECLSHQPGWIAEHFGVFDNGLYLDLLLAESRERAEAICQLWNSNAVCQQFVSLVQDVDMKFGGLA